MILDVGIRIGSLSSLRETLLFDASYRHKHHNKPDCDECCRCHHQEDHVCKASEEPSCDELKCQGGLVNRRRLSTNLGVNTAPAIHIGRVALGDGVMKSGVDRDEIVEQEGIIAFEMEGAGVWDVMPCLIIKAICDYSDSHKNKRFQPYAAASAAACAKAILQEWGSTPEEL
ncbi:uncharacterized protein ASPGLDRAFT_78505 [Aspergillus glaucus CBS 516.65]|uniref:Nucleoside phosphorylase domain-containing protein n=1 Tax=Aspergillus glaucus CBS 516.65 TaxID=1160497 RepID=A0A1L9VZH4_ASPGL|nr:hypothetical protein ASPGLDRAFT_78505 [Aspergillus glaucus CBS 516.65]OJJ89318.1 hypothetical protein ASPGLDRAFT_78505 [Aspergillus glaucus CBS 516.65]